MNVIKRGGNTLDVNMKTTAILLFLLSGFSYSKMASSCDGTAGLAALYSNNESRAYELLKACAADLNASGETLHQLHGFAYFTNYGNYSSFDERMIDSEQLLCRAVHKGYSTSVVVLASYYEQGDKSLGIRKNSLVGNCLFGLQKNDLKYANILDVQACLSLNPDIDATYECY